MSELAVGQLKGLTANANKIVVPSGHTLYAPGHVIQVQSVTKTNSASTTATTWQDIPGMAVSITPKFSTSKILVSFSIGVANGTSSWSMLQLWRDSTAIGTTTLTTNATFVANPSPSSGEIIPVVVSYLDAPSTTSIVTYKLTFMGNTPGVTTWVGSRAGGDIGMISHITVTEIAA